MIPTAREKVLGLEVLAETVREAQVAGKTVALCHGCFDILHCGHLRHLEAARRLADALVVSITPDEYVNKGSNRPVFPAEQRAELVAGLVVVDWVTINRWPSAIELIRMVRPNLFVKGQEYENRALEVNPNFLAEAEAVEGVGGKVAFTYEFTASSSTAFRRLTGVAE